MHLIDSNEFVELTGQLKKRLAPIARGLRALMEKLNLYIGFANLTVAASFAAILLVSFVFVFHLRMSGIEIVAGAILSSGAALCLIFCLRALLDDMLRRNGLSDRDAHDTY